MRPVWLAFVTALSTGCWTSSEAPARATPYPESRPVMRVPYPARSEWRGLYRCSQGLTAVTLTLEARANGALEGVFAFGPSEDNPMIPSGAYKLAGTINAAAQGTFEIRLEPVEWLMQPDGYIMVALSATSSRKWRRLVGRIEHPSCGEFDVRRAD